MESISLKKNWADREARLLLIWHLYVVGKEASGTTFTNVWYGTSSDTHGWLPCNQLWIKPIINNMAAPMAKPCFAYLSNIKVKKTIAKWIFLQAIFPTADKCQWFGRGYPTMGLAFFYHLNGLPWPKLILAIMALKAGASTLRVKQLELGVMGGWTQDILPMG